jgi:hypothetical protein
VSDGIAEERREESVLADDDDLAMEAATIQLGQTVCPLGAGVAPAPEVALEGETSVADSMT